MWNKCIVFIAMDCACSVRFHTPGHVYPGPPSSSSPGQPLQMPLVQSNSEVLLPTISGRLQDAVSKSGHLFDSNTRISRKVLNTPDVLCCPSGPSPSLFVQAVLRCCPATAVQLDIMLKVCPLKAADESTIQIANLHQVDGNTVQLADVRASTHTMCRSNQKPIKLL